MKIDPLDYAALEQACREVLDRCPGIVDRYRDKGLSDMRLRWDVLHASGFKTAPLYNVGLDDNHIDTALRRIVKQVEKQS